jgi:hypothetical protein
LLDRYNEQPYDGSAFRRIGDPMLELESVRIKFPEGTNIIVGQTHFIKTAEDMYEAVVNAVLQVPPWRRKKNVSGLRSREGIVIGCPPKRLGVRLSHEVVLHSLDTNGSRRTRVRRLSIVSKAPACNSGSM